MPQRLHDNGYYALMGELDPTRPPVCLHNSFESAQNGLALNRPTAITHDQYAFSLDLRTSSLTSLTRSIGAILGLTREYRQIGDAHDVPLWFMGQSFGEPSAEDYATPPYGQGGGMRTLSAAKGFYAVVIQKRSDDE